MLVWVAGGFRGECFFAGCGGVLLGLVGSPGVVGVEPGCSGGGCLGLVRLARGSYAVVVQRVPLWVMPRLTSRVRLIAAQRIARPRLLRSMPRYRTLR
jgi:hypothetical protein